MNHKKYHLLVAVILSCLINSIAYSQNSDRNFDVSTVFIDFNADDADYVGSDLVTLGHLERVLFVERDENNPDERVVRFNNILEFIDPLLDDDMLNVFQEINPAAVRDDGENRRLNPEGGAAAIAPILAALENNNLSSQSRRLLTDDFKGMSLFSVLSALHYAVCLDLEKEVIETQGSNEPTILCARPGLGNINQWSYNRNTGEGFIRIDDMKVDYYKINFADGNVVYDLVEQSSYSWHITIGSPGYDEAKRMTQSDYISMTAGGDVVDPFITTVQRTPPPPRQPSLPDEAKDVDNTVNSIWSRGLDLRLTAHGASIEIESITEKRYAMSPFDENTLGDDASLPLYIDFTGKYYKRGQVLAETYALDANHPYLQTSDKSCIDILFAGNYPRHRIEFPPNQTGWCMGRCSHPVIVNSGE